MDCTAELAAVRGGVATECIDAWVAHDRAVQEAAHPLGQRLPRDPIRRSLSQQRIDMLAAAQKVLCGL